MNESPKAYKCKIQSHDTESRKTHIKSHKSVTSKPYVNYRFGIGTLRRADNGKHHRESRRNETPSINIGK